MKARLAIMSLMALVMTSCTTSPRLSYLTVPEVGTDSSESIDLQDYEDKYGRYDAVFLLHEDVIEHYGTRQSGYEGWGSSWHYLRLHRDKYVVFDLENEHLTSFRTGLVPDQMYVRITTPDGEVRQYDAKDLREEKSGDGDTDYALIYPDIVKGTIIETGWERNYKVSFFPPPLSHDLPLQFYMPCESLTVTYACPEWWTLAFKKLGPDHEVNTTTTRDTANKKMVIQYIAENVPAVEHEPFSPYFKEVADYLEFAVIDLEMKGHKITEPGNWQKIGQDFRKHALKKSRKAHDAVRAKAAEIVSDCSTDLEKVKAVVAWISDNISVRYRYSEGDYTSVLKNKAGSAVDVAGLVQAMLDSQGIKASYLLVHSAEDGYFDPDYVHTDQLGAPAVRVLIDSVDYVLFPFIEDLPVGLIPPQYRSQMALQMAGGATTLWQLPAGSVEDNTTGEFYSLRIAPSGLIEVTEVNKLHGADAFFTRGALEVLNEDETSEFMKDILTYTDGDVYLDSFEVRNLDKIDLPLIFELYYSIDNLVTVTDEEVIFQTAGLFSPLSLKEYRMEPSDRVNPINIRSDEQHDKQITIKFPSEWAVVTELQDVGYENDFGSISSSCRMDDTCIAVAQELRLNQIHSDKSRLEDLLALIGRKSQLHIPTIVFAVKEGSPKPESPETTGSDGGR